MSGSQKEVVVIVHETICKTDKGILQEGFIDFIKEYFPVLIIIENRFSSIASCGDMVDCILKGQSQRSCHAERLT